MNTRNTLSEEGTEVVINEFSRYQKAFPTKVEAATTVQYEDRRLGTKMRLGG